MVRLEGKTELEEVRERTETTKRGSEVNADRMLGPRWPPAPMMKMFLREEDIFDDDDDDEMGELVFVWKVLLLSGDIRDGEFREVIL